MKKAFIWLFNIDIHIIWVLGEIKKQEKRVDFLVDSDMSNSIAFLRKADLFSLVQAPNCVSVTGCFFISCANFLRNCEEAQERTRPPPDVTVPKAELGWQT